MTNDSPLVSVVIPFFNAGAFIQETIKSVLAQTYDHWELLLVDDGSTDGSTELAGRYAQQYPEKVRFLEHPGHQNRGPSASHNLGISHGKGKYIAMLDADDMWLPQKLHRQVALLESHPEAAMTYGPSQWWYSWTGNAEDRQRDFMQVLSAPVNTLIKPSTVLSLFLRQQTEVPVPSAVLVKREVIDRTGGWEEACRTPYIDQVFYAKICLDPLAAPVLVDRESYVMYRKHPDSLVAVMRRTGQGPVVRLAFLTWLEEYLARQQVRHYEVWTALRQALWPYRHPLMHRISTRARYRISQIETLLKLPPRRVPGHIYARLQRRWQRQAG